MTDTERLTAAMFNPIVKAWCMGKTGRRVGDGLVLRAARIEHRCRSRFCAFGHEPIKVGERYIEYLGEAPGYQSGSAYHMVCASVDWLNWLDACAICGGDHDRSTREDAPECYDRWRVLVRGLTA